MVLAGAAWLAKASTVFNIANAPTNCTLMLAQVVQESTL
jgi:hypothetical protein